MIDGQSTLNSHLDSVKRTTKLRCAFVVTEVQSLISRSVTLARTWSVYEGLLESAQDRSDNCNDTLSYRKNPTLTER